MSELLQAFPESRDIVSAHAAFIQSGVAIDLATCDAKGNPYVTIGCGCRATARRNRVTVLVQRTFAEPFLAALAQSGVIAATFGRPSTHESLQLKGKGVTIGTAATRERAVFTSYHAAFTADMERAGFPPDVTAAYLGAGRNLATVSFEPRAAYAQTPGPDAGMRLA